MFITPATVTVNLNFSMAVHFRPEIKSDINVSLLDEGESIRRL